MHQIENLGNDGNVCIHLDPNNNMHKDMYAQDDLVGTEFASNANFIVSTRACSAHFPNRSVVLVYDRQASSAILVWQPVHCAEKQVHSR